MKIAGCRRGGSEAGRLSPFSKKNIMNLFGKYFDDNERALKSLTKIYGVGRITAEELSMVFGIGSKSKVKDLSKELWSRIVQAIEFGPQKAISVTLRDPPSGWSGSSLIGKSLSELSVKGGLSLVDPRSGKTQTEGLSEGHNGGFSNTYYKKLTQQLCEARAKLAIKENIDLEKKIRSYRGLRHIEGLPCRGQRTHTNGLTARKKPV